MDNDQLLDELKQYMNGRLSQTEQYIHEEIKELRTEVHEGFASIGDIVTAHNEQIDDLEIRTTKLEPKTA